MKTNSKKNKRSFLLIAILTILVSSSFMIFGKANDFTLNIDQFNEVIQASPNECWKKPAQNRKNSISNKLTELQQLITEENFEKAYDKLLYDIKPKLTGLKQDERGDPWGSGVFEKTWVTCDELQVSFGEECNLILSQINPLSVYDDDKTPPSISIQYVGEENVNNPGIWHVEIVDQESGLDAIIIYVNGIGELFDLQGDVSVSYDVLVPAIAQFHMIEVIATNDDKDYVGDQETSTESDWVEIIADVTPPTIVPPEDVEYEVGSIGNALTWIVTDENPGTYEIFFEGASFESGVWFSGVPITIGVDGFPLGSYQFSIEIYDSYANYAVDNVNVVVTEDDDTTGPTIGPYNSLYVYSGTGTTYDPGWWTLQIEDLESGLDEVIILINGFEIDHQNLDGQQSISYSQIDALPLIDCHWFKVITTNNDLEWAGDQERTVYFDVVKIIPESGPPPSEYGPPFISIDYNGENDPGVWNVVIEDLNNGIQDVKILIDGEEYLYEENLENIFSITYSDIPVPSALGIHKIEVEVLNNHAPVGGQIMGGHANTEFLETVIVDDDISPPIIALTPSMEVADADAIGGVSVDWSISDASGIAQASVLLNGAEIASYGPAESISGSYLLPSVPGVNVIDVVARDNDNDPDHPGDDWLESSAQTVITIFDDDVEPPVIGWYYEGDATTENPGVWNVIIEDMGAGLAAVIILIDDIVVIEDSNLEGIASKAYNDIAVPATEGTHTIEVIVIDNDNEWPGDQQASSSSGSIVIVTVIEDDTPPSITIHYSGDNSELLPGEWIVDIEDLESGIDEVQILRNGIEVINEINLNGITQKRYYINVPGIEGTYTIEVTAINNDKDYVGDQESHTESDEVQIIFVPPMPLP